ncbi:amidase [Actinomadura sp. LD22]|uniref:Amidase n=1 Tax=Actinomadura physcomitrii TaxID=2650748 RepID=A0A6I4ML01_9ACTN|nr:amidase [Actinomadura physcomitrii]MWA02906.1 amidase [Actinomadura physcomitrii]
MSTDRAARLDRIAGLDAGLGAFVTLDRDGAAGPAAPHGPLAGWWLGIKDVIDVAGLPTLAQSRVESGDPAAADAVAVARTRAAGAAVAGKTSTMEYAIGAPDPDGPFPVPRNPWDRDRWTGGSSSGSAAAVAAGMVRAALGTDTGGSIRMPAAFCGVTGLKPSFGRVPNSGSRALAASADTIGPMARTVRDCAVLLGVLAGPDDGDPDSADRPVPDYAAELERDVRGLRVGVWRPDAPWEAPGLWTAYDEALEVLGDLGCRPVPVEPPAYRRVLAAHRVTLRCESLAEHRARLAERWDDYSPGFRESVAPGIYYTAADYLDAQRVRRAAVRELRGLFESVDVVVSPTASVTAPPVGSVSPGFERWMRHVHTGYWNSTGCPALSVPMRPAADGLPLGLQIAAAPFGESAVLRLGHAFQSRTGWHRAVPAHFFNTSVDDLGGGG